MKLAEALIERAELKKRNGRLLSRIKANVLVQEGDEPAEDYAEMIAEYEDNMERLLELTQRVNKTNSKTPFDGSISIAEAIALRDSVKAKSLMYREIHEQSTITQFKYGYSKNEVKFVRCINVKELQNTIDRLSKEYREIDTKIQGLNWTAELL